MKAYELRDAFGIDNLRIAELPQPAEPAAGQVVVRMHAWSLNFRDLLVVKGHYNPKLRFPFVPLSDGAGEVVAVGPGVSRVAVGDRVAGIFMQDWLDGPLDQAKARSALGGAIPGVLAEYVSLNAEGLVKLPDHLSYEEGATLPCAAVTAWHALVTSGDIKSGDTVLIQGTGGVSLFALQFAQLRGAEVIATSSSDEKLDRVKAMGASHGINYKKLPSWGDAVRQLAGEGVVHVVEVGGAGTLQQSLTAVRMGGHISVIGVLSGAGQIDPVPILMKNVRMQGIFVGSRTMFEEMNYAISQSQLRPVVDRAFSFEEVPAALRHMESGSHFGKIVIRR